MVQVGQQVDGALTDWVGVDDDAGFAQLVDHLVAAGRRRLVFVGSALRLDPVTKALRGRGLTAAQEPLLDTFDAGWGLAAAARIDLPSVDGVVCGDDATALGVLRGLRKRGVSVPTDVAVTGFDDITFAEFADPPLTTVRHRWDAMADSACGCCSSPRSTARERWRSPVPTLRVRESTPAEPAR